MTTAPPDDQIAAAVRRALPQARAAWLFGSVVNGTLRPDSDLDIAVSLQHPLGAELKRSAIERLQHQLGWDIDLLDFARLHTVMQYQVLATGRILFDLDPARTADYSGFVSSEYQNIQTWRQPLVQQLTARLVGI